MRGTRRLSRRLNAAARIVHHVSQAVGRDNIRDMYAPRGASAFTDNARQNHQLSIVRLTEQKTIEHEGVTYELPDTIAVEDFIRGHVLAIFTHKVSYLERDPTPIVLVRHGFAFQQIPIAPRDGSPMAEENRREINMERVIAHVRGTAVDGIKLTRTDMDGQSHLDALGLTRKEVRNALHRALGMHALAETPLPKTERRTQRTKFLIVTPPITPNNAAVRGGIPDKGRRDGAANNAAALPSRRRRDSKATKRLNHDDAKESLPGRIPPSATVKPRLNGKATYDV